MSCTELAKLLQAERPDLRREFDRHKYFMSMESGRDVGIARATEDFIRNHLNDWAEGYKDCFCSQVCVGKCSDYLSRKS